MTSLYNKFVNAYCSKHDLLSFRRLYENSWSNIDRGGEVSAIREYLLSPNVGIDFLNKNIAQKFKGSEFNLKFASVFCHQKPRVTRTVEDKNRNAGDTLSCELGDLFVLFLLMDGNDKVHYSSGAIFQAKLRDKLDSKTQRCLYDNDNAYILPKYIISGRDLTSSERKMPTYDDGRGKAFRYLILNPEKEVREVKARYTPYGNNYQLRWSTFIDGLIAGTDGLRVDLNTDSPSAWDDVVQDLLWVVNNIKKGKPARGNNAASNIATGLFNDYTNFSEYSAEFESEYGMIPMMLIIAHAPEHIDENSRK
ncbi:hypothetical protein [Serratia marcescens]|uniref:hypothetical protein n=1 Tax=Serratia marcescens TaxID=615 RepID=UPI00398357E6